VVVGVFVLFCFCCGFVFGLWFVGFVDCLWVIGCVGLFLYLGRFFVVRWGVIFLMWVFVVVLG